MGGRGPAAVLPRLIAEAGIEVLDGEVADPDDGYLELPGGGRLYLADGGPATTGPALDYVQFDLALDYRVATRVAIAPSDSARPETVQAAIGLFQALGKKVSVIEDVPGMIVARTVAMLVDFATDAVARGGLTGGRRRRDAARRELPARSARLGAELGPEWVREVLRNLHQAYPGGRYAPSVR